MSFSSVRMIKLFIKVLLFFLMFTLSHQALSDPTNNSELEGIYGTKGSVAIYPMYLKISSSDNGLEISRYQLNSLTNEKEWMPIDCETSCVTKFSSETDVGSLIPLKAAEMNDIKCVFNQKNAICKITPKNNSGEPFFAWVARASGQNIYNEKVKKFTELEFSQLTIKPESLKHAP